MFSSSVCGCVSPDVPVRAVAESSARTAVPQARLGLFAFQCYPSCGRCSIPLVTVEPSSHFSRSPRGVSLLLRLVSRLLLMLYCIFCCLVVLFVGLRCLLRIVFVHLNRTFPFTTASSSANILSDAVASLSRDRRLFRI